MYKKNSLVVSEAKKLYVNYVRKFWRLEASI